MLMMKVMNRDARFAEAPASSTAGTSPALTSTRPEMKMVVMVIVCSAVGVAPQRVHSVAAEGCSAFGVAPTRVYPRGTEREKTHCGWRENAEMDRSE